MTYTARFVLSAMVAMAVALGGVQLALAAPALTMEGDSSSAMHNAEGIKHYNKKHWDKAAEHFEEAVEADPKAAVAHYNYALALDKLGKHQDAAMHFKKAQDLGKDNPDIQNSGILKAHVDMLK